MEDASINPACRARSAISQALPRLAPAEAM